MTSSPTIAVVGHANTGKTSLLQTLLRRRDFGEISPTGGTTTKVESGTIRAGDHTIATVLDTPGLEDSIGLRDHLEHDAADRREDGRSRLDRFMESPRAGEFEPEVRALRAAIDADVLLYTIDAREEPRPRHLDELAILSMTARPLIPVLNFVARPEANVAAWREACSRQGLHATVAFDAVVFDDHGERRLLESVRTLLPDSAPAIDAWIKLRSQQRDLAVQQAAEDAAELLVNAAAAVVVTDAGDDDRERALARATETLLDRLRIAETQVRTKLCQRFGFEGAAAEATAIEVAEALGGVDIMSQASLERAGLWAAGAGTGLVAAGAMVDLVLGGITLGGFTALGAVGAAIGAVGASGSKIIRRLRGQDEARLGEASLELLAKRQVATIAGLLARGHAAIEPMNIDAVVGNQLKTFEPDQVIGVLRKARDRANWSMLSEPPGSTAGHTAPQRITIMADIAAFLEAELASHGEKTGSQAS